MGFGEAELAGVVKSEEPFHHAEALFHAEASARNELVEAFLRCSQRATTRRLAHDAITVLARLVRLGLA